MHEFKAGMQVCMQRIAVCVLATQATHNYATLAFSDVPRLLRLCTRVIIVHDDGSKVITSNNLSCAEESLETRLMIVH